MNQLFLTLSLTLPILILASVQPDLYCNNFVNDAQILVSNYSCQFNSCVINDGFSRLIVNESTNKIFKLCLDFKNVSVTINNQGKKQPISIDSSLYINAPSVSIIDNTVLQVGDTIVIETQDNITFKDVTIRGARLWFFSYSIQIYNSNFINQSTIQTQCTCLPQQQNSSANCRWNFSYPSLFQHSEPIFNIERLKQETFFNYSVVLQNSATFIAFDQIIINNVEIDYSIIGFFANTMNIKNSLISTTGLGYPSGAGKGCGYFNENLNNYIGCTGSGGSYGGFGGNSAPLDNCKLMVSQQPYGSIQYPNEPGSGGGYILAKSYQSSSGGGVINIQVYNLSMNNTQIMAQGKSGKQGGGGGAGGSISIDFYEVLSKNYTTISANGGSGQKLSSSGSGGRIRYWDHNSNATINSKQFWIENFFITANGGTNCQEKLGCGENGSIFISPCGQGQYLNLNDFQCTYCAYGQYQLSTGYSACLRCPQLPDNAEWDTASVYMCNYKCQDGYLDLNGNCLSQIQHNFQSNQLGNILISIGMILTALLLFGTVKCMQFLLKNQNQHLSQYYQSGDNERKKIFRVHDLPYHQYRIYLKGQNTPKHPWHISALAQNNFDQQVKEQYNMAKIRNKIKILFENVNQKAIYNKQQKVILFLLHFYPPCQRLMLSYFQRKKVKKIQAVINQFNRQQNNLEEMYIKFHVKPYRTVATIEIFDFNKKQQDFDIEKCYPLYFMLEKTPFGGHLLDLTDPFLRLLLTQISQKQGYLNELQNFFKQLNIKLKKRQQTIACLNQLQKLGELSSRLQAFLWQPPNRILGVNLDYQINHQQPLFFVISSQNLNNNHFYLENKLSEIYFNEVEALKKVIEIKQNYGNEDHGSNFWIFENEIAQKTLIWILGFFTITLLALSIAPIVLIILIQIPGYTACSPENQMQKKFTYAFYVAFVAIAPFCNFVLCFFNFKTTLQKNEYILYNSMILTFLTFIKSIVLFLLTVPILFTSTSNECSQTCLFVQLASAITCISIYVSQIMLRSRIITNAK